VSGCVCRPLMFAGAILRDGLSWVRDGLSGARDGLSGARDGFGLYWRKGGNGCERIRIRVVIQAVRCEHRRMPCDAPWISSAQHRSNSCLSLAPKQSFTFPWAAGPCRTSAHTLPKRTLHITRNVNNSRHKLSFCPCSSKVWGIYFAPSIRKSKRLPLFSGSFHVRLVISFTRPRCSA
jgi:hypothetical protein